MKKLNIKFIFILFAIIIFISGFFVLLNGDIMIKTVGIAESGEVVKDHDTGFLLSSGERTNPTFRVGYAYPEVTSNMGITGGADMNIDEIQFFQNNYKELFEVNGNTHTNDTQKNDKCPDLLIKRDGKILLYNSSLSNQTGVNPIEFKDLNEYSDYLDKQSKDGIVCPVLFLQKETDAQNNNVYRVRQSPFYIEGGLPALPLEIHNNNIPVKTIDASRENGYNQGSYPGFDPYNLNIGRYSDLDMVHYSTEKRQGGSLNPADPNWLGVVSTQQAVDSGMFKENEVNKALYKNVMHIT